MVWDLANLLYQRMTPPKVLGPVQTRYTGYAEERLTFVTSVVAASISRSSADRSANPGSTCFAWSLSSVVTGGIALE